MWRPSKSEVRDGFILHVRSDADIEAHIIKRKTKLAEFNLTLQPLIIVVGESLKEVQSYIVVVNTTKYFFNHIVEAVDSYLKIIFTLNAKFSEESKSAWLVIQQGFYKIKTNFDKTPTTTSTLLTELGI